jgi:hypothetical protein
MFRGGLDWPVACNEVPDLTAPPETLDRAAIAGKSLLTTECWGLRPCKKRAYQKVSTTSQKVSCLEGNVQSINDEEADDVADPIGLHEPSFV